MTRNRRLTAVLWLWRHVLRVFNTHIYMCVCVCIYIWLFDGWHTCVGLQVSLDYSREEKVNHEEVLQISKMRAEVLQKLVSTLISRCQQQSINTHWRMKSRLSSPSLVSDWDFSLIKLLSVHLSALSPLKDWRLNRNSNLLGTFMFLHNKKKASNFNFTLKKTDFLNPCLKVFFLSKNRTSHFDNWCTYKAVVYKYSGVRDQD